MRQGWRWYGPDTGAVLRECVAIDARRSTDGTPLFRPDHGRRMLDDVDEAVIGRLKGSAALRGILHALGAPPEM